MATRSRRRVKSSTSKNDVLKVLIGMPMDIIFEIFGYLDPLDLLRLARTTKALRAILMSQSSLSLWKRVRRAYYQMPDGPDGMSEPQYASLSLDLICDGCGISDSESSFVHIYWNAQLNSCDKCESILLVNESNLKEFDSFKIIPSWLLSLIQESISNIHFVYSNYSLKQAQVWSQEYKSLSGSSANLKEWQCRIIEKNELTKKHVESFHSWILRREKEVSAEHSRQIEAINKALSIKLEELGWGEEISKMSTWENYEMYHNFPMNCKLEVESFPQVWSLNGPTILKKLKVIQTSRIEMERRILLSSRYVVLQEIYNEYIRGLPADALIPTIADVALFPLVHAIITDERTDFIVTRQTFEDINLMQTLPSIFSDWKIRLDDELVRMVQVDLSEPFTKDQLQLATTVFYCDACDIDLFYPRVLVHECSITYLRNPVQCPAWNSSGNIKFNRDVHQSAIDIIRVLGFDPKTVTAHDMMVRNCVVQCLDCRTTRLGRMTMIWNRAIEHSRKEHDRPPSMISWKVPGHDGQLTLQARLAQAFAESDHLDSAQPRFMCGVCRRKGTRPKLNQHLLSAHGIEDPVEHDILFHPDANQVPMPCVFPETD